MSLDAMLLDIAMFIVFVIFVLGIFSNIKK